MWLTEYNIYALILLLAVTASMFWSYFRGHDDFRPLHALVFSLAGGFLGLFAGSILALSVDKYLGVVIGYAVRFFLALYFAITFERFVDSIESNSGNE